MSKQEAIKLQQDLFLPFFIQRIFSAICGKMDKPTKDTEQNTKDMYKAYQDNLTLINKMCIEIAERGKHTETAIRRIKRTVNGIINLLEPSTPDIKKMNTQHYMQLICFLFEDLQEEFNLTTVHETLYTCMEMFFRSYEMVGFNQKQQKATVKREEKVFRYLNEQGLFLKHNKEAA